MFFLATYFFIKKEWDSCFKLSLSSMKYLNFNIPMFSIKSVLGRSMDFDLSSGTTLLIYASSILEGTIDSKIATGIKSDL